jgi:tetratricopeptide (TPR) repeat protein
MSNEASDVLASKEIQTLKKFKVRMGVGRMAYEAGYFTQAARHFRQALEMCEQERLDEGLTSRALLGLAKSTVALGLYDEAEKLIRRALVIDETDSASLVEEAEDYHQLSLLYWRSGRPDLAMEFAQKSWSLADQDECVPDELKAKLLKHFAVLAEQAGKLDECEQYLNQALELIESSPDLNKQSSIYGDTLLVKVLLLAEQGRLDEASELYPHAINIVQMNRGVSHPRVNEVLSLFEALDNGTLPRLPPSGVQEVLTSAQKKGKHGII